MDILKEEQVSLERIVGHGGLYKTGSAGQRFTAAALNTPITVMETAGEGGAWGIALLAAYCAGSAGGAKLEDYLHNNIFAKLHSTHLAPDPADAEGFARYLERFRQGLHIERAAVEHLC